MSPRGHRIVKAAERRGLMGYARVLGFVRNANVCFGPVRCRHAVFIKGKSQHKAHLRMDVEQVKQ